MYRAWSLLCFMACSCLSIGQPLPALIPYNSNGKWGYTDTNGNVVIAPQWDEVRFFRGDRTTVILHKSNGTSVANIFCTINTRGEYIIPPERNWTQQGKTWTGPLNTCDANGAWGLIDSDNHLLITYQWQQGGYSDMSEGLKDSFKVVSRDGLCGVINRENKVVIPCSYGSISCEGLMAEKLRAFIVSDPDNQSGMNKMGVTDIYGRKLLPMRYARIVYEETYGRKGFRAAIAADNDPRANNYNNPATRQVWIDYPSLKEGTPPPDPLPAAKQERNEGDYIFFGYNYSGLMDRSRKIIIPEGGIERQNADTIMTLKQETTGDTLVLTRTFLNAHTLTPYGPPVVKYIYQRPYEYDHPRSFVCGNGARAWSEGQSRRGAIPDITVEGYTGKEFFKDSFFYQVQKYVPGEAMQTDLLYRRWGQEYGRRDMQNRLYAVSGYTRAGSHNGVSYGAVVDEQANYIVPPLRNQQVMSYNAPDDIITVNGYSERHKMSGYGLVSRNGELLYRFRNAELSGGCRWHGKIYAFVNSKEYKTGVLSTPFGDEMRLGILHVKIADTSGEISPVWKRLDMIGQLPADLLPVGEAGFLGADSSGILSVVNPQGEIIWPAVSGKYKSLSCIGNGWFLAKTDGRYGHLVDKNNKDVLNGFNVEQVLVVAASYSFSNFIAEPPLPRMLNVSGYAEDITKPVAFYLNYNGTAYTDVIKQNIKPGRKRM